MKVRCNNSDGWSYKLRILWIKLWDVVTKGPKERDIVTVAGEEFESGERYYILMEWPNGSYLSSCFDPLEEKYEKITTSQIKEVPCKN